MGANNASQIATLVERSTRFVLLVELRQGRTAALVAEALAEKITTLPDALRRSLTWDRGTEMAAHAQFTISTGCRSTSAIRTVPGSAAQTRTPTACCGSTSRKAPACAATPKPTSTPSQTNSTTGLDKHSAGRHHPKH